MAEARLWKLMAEVTVAPVYERMTVEEAGERLIKHLVTRGRKPSTTIGYQSYLGVHLGPFFGEKPIADITKEQVEEFVATCLENDQSVKSTRTISASCTASSTSRSGRDGRRQSVQGRREA